MIILIKLKKQEMETVRTKTKPTNIELQSYGRYKDELQLRKELEHGEKGHPLPLQRHICAGFADS